MPAPFKINLFTEKPEMSSWETAPLSLSTPMHTSERSATTLGTKCSHSLLCNNTRLEAEHMVSKLNSGSNFCQQDVITPLVKELWNTSWFQALIHMETKCSTNTQPSARASLAWEAVKGREHILYCLRIQGSPSKCCSRWTAEVSVTGMATTQGEISCLSRQL